MKLPRPSGPGHRAAPYANEHGEHSPGAVLASRVTAPMKVEALPQPARGQSRNGRVALLTSTLGSGHLRAAQAIEVALLERCPGTEVQILDFWSLMDPDVAQTVRQGYLRLVVEHPDLYDRLYQLDQRHWRDIVGRRAAPPAILAEVAKGFLAPPEEPSPAGGERHMPDRILLAMLRTALAAAGSGKGAWERLAPVLIGWGWARMARRLRGRLLAFAPDVVVATQMHPAALLSFTKARAWLDVPVIGVPTDFGLHDFWRQPGIDRYCVPHESIVQAWAGDHEPVPMVATGIPLMPGFRNPPDPREARRQLKLDADRPVVLVLGGGLGLGVDAVAERLLARLPDVQVLAHAGRNAPARNVLEGLAARFPGRLSVWDWSERMDTFMRAADIVVGKPGGLTVAEALACGRPLLATRSLRGQESFNVRFLEQHDVGWLLPEDELVERVESLLANPAELSRIQERAWNLGRRDAAAQIAAMALAWVSSSEHQQAESEA